MQRIGQELLADRAVSIKELAANVEVEDVFAIRERRDDLAGLRILVPSAARPFAAREYREEQHIDVGVLPLELTDDGSDPLRDVLRRVGAVVRADHDDRRRRFDSVNLAVVQPPEHVLRAVTAEAEVDGVARRVEPGPHVPADALPPLRDRVANEQQLGIAVLYHLQSLPVPLGPPFLIGPAGRDNTRIRRRISRVQPNGARAASEYGEHGAEERAAATACAHGGLHKLTPMVRDAIARSELSPRRDTSGALRGRRVLAWYFRHGRRRSFRLGGHERRFESSDTRWPQRGMMSTSW
jgi:hypothetical protein